MHLFHSYSVDTFKIPHSIRDNLWISINVKGLRYLLNLSKNLHALKRPDIMRPSFAPFRVYSKAWGGRNPPIPSEGIPSKSISILFLQSIYMSHKLFIAFSAFSNCNSEDPTTLLHSYSCCIPRPPHSPYFTSTTFIKQCQLLVFSVQSLQPLISSYCSNETKINSTNIIKNHITLVSPLFNISNQAKCHINDRF